MNVPIALRLPDAFTTGIPTIDRQHNDLIDRLNEFLKTCNGEMIDNFEQLFADFIRVLQSHFETEEELMAEAEFPGLEKHANHHRHCLGELEHLLERCRVHGFATTRDVVTFFQKIIDDISKADLTFVSFLLDEDMMKDFNSR